MLDARHAILHHVWATGIVLDVGRALSSRQLELTTPGTAGSIAYCLAHIVGGDQRYLAGLLDRPPDRPLRESTGPSFDAVEATHAANRAAWAEVLDAGLDLADWIPNPLASPQPQQLWERAATRRWVMLVQALHHGADHRTHIASILGAHGLELPESDVWAYANALGDLRDELPEARLR